MCRAMMAMTMPTARIITEAFCWMRLAKLLGDSSRPPVMTWKKTMIATSAARIPY